MSKNVVVGVTGGIACYKSADMVSRLKKEGFEVDVIMTENACKFISPLTFRTLSKNPVVTDTFATPEAWKVGHIALADKADVFVIAPATANVIGKIASGIADDMLTTTVMATKARVVIAPAMNVNMYENPIVQSNIEKLKSFGYEFIEPDSGLLACGYEGKGRMSEPAEIVRHIVDILNEKESDKLCTDCEKIVSTAEIIEKSKSASACKSSDLAGDESVNVYEGSDLAGDESENTYETSAMVGDESYDEAKKAEIGTEKNHTLDFEGKKLLVTAGPTVEVIDPVRYISNKSSGRMGYAVAEAALKRGADVILVSGPVSLECPKGAQLIKVTSTKEMLAACESVFDDVDAVVKAAAPADYYVVNTSEHKMKKEDGDVTIHLAENPDILKTLGKRKKHQIMAGFAAETRNLEEYAKKKIISKNLDMIVANNVANPKAGFDVDTNIITIIKPDGEMTSYDLMTKREAADVILDKVAEAIRERNLR